MLQGHSLQQYQCTVEVYEPRYTSKIILIKLDSYIALIVLDIVKQDLCREYDILVFF